MKNITVRTWGGEVKAKIYNDGTFSVYGRSFMIEEKLNDRENILYTVLEFNNGEWNKSVVDGFEYKGDHVFYCGAIERSHKEKTIAALEILAELG